MLLRWNVLLCFWATVSALVCLVCSSTFVRIIYDMIWWYYFIINGTAVAGPSVPMAHQCCRYVNNAFHGENIVFLFPLTTTTMCKMSHISCSTLQHIYPTAVAHLLRFCWNEWWASCMVGFTVRSNRMHCIAVPHGTLRRFCRNLGQYAATQVTTSGVNTRI